MSGDEPCNSVPVVYRNFEENGAGVCFSALGKKVPPVSSEITTLPPLVSECQAVGHSGF